MGAAEPQTDRELLLQLNGDIKGLTASVERLNDILIDMRETEIKELHKKVYDLEKWKSELSGGWKLVAIIWAVITGGIVALVKTFF
jgi:hypothetical protein